MDTQLSHQYRTHHCGQLRISDVGRTVKLSGWVHRKRDHGGVHFIDLRDHYGITQIVSSYQDLDIAKLSGEQYEVLRTLSYESVITVVGQVVQRSKDTVNADIPTGEIEVVISNFTVESEAEQLPLSVNSNHPFPEDIRLRYRFLDLRRERLHNNIMLRSQVISFIRQQMNALGFMEFQTPILTASSPEGARDFLVPSRLHPGKFYALPQAPQQFKQLIIASGFDKYFQIAPCFRDEDARADRAPGEFYQLDLEMSFVTQEDVFVTVEHMLCNLFKTFSNLPIVEPFPRIAYHEALLRYGTDKPDLRNPIEIVDVTSIFAQSNFALFKGNILEGMVVRGIPAPSTASKSRSFFDKIVDFAQTELGAQGLGYITFTEDDVAKGPIAKFLSTEELKMLKNTAEISSGDSIFFVCNHKNIAAKIAGQVRTKLAEELNIIQSNVYRFCWITDFPFYEWNESENKVDFCHNPFSMPQGGLEALTNAKTIEDKLNIKAFQYDIVCNGIELSSGAIRNHKLEIMYKAFEIAGYDKESVDSKFGGLLKAFQFGVPPHGGIAPGIDRIVMLLANEANIREVICFPLNQNGKDLLMDAPNVVSAKQLQDLHITLTPSAKLCLKTDK
ncbi:aspartate--tRNA ligase [Rickettsiales endosymbiont of Peranema trichophorum]|uniref:aspartate--tRNA ligase n=1 Tax=Rickettsiales endosymbiont of Peranema trichophorum TaxID=2486577 RepID=UPI00102353BE|nr:aspartate--tRNA ligase [Rickettsiales endosymbiont of Peranema trichophorum]RZI47313.1 aspartate--tRNA ligase [Rickettsiales endosymbiont of Peranema trichophorum]